MQHGLGISLRALFELAPESALRDYVGAATIDVLSVLDPSKIQKDKLIDLALGKLDNADIINEKQYRDKIVNLLPLHKARELAVKLSLDSSDGQIYSKLECALEAKPSQQVLMSFLGIVLDVKYSKDTKNSIIRIGPKYGLFDHQFSIENRTLSLLREHPHKAVVHMPTGSGKTRTAMHIIARIIIDNPDKLVIWLAQSAELLEQAAEEFEKAWACLGIFPVDVCRFWGEYEPDISNFRRGFLVAGFGKLNALYKRDENMIMKLGDRAILTVVDEAHQAIAPTYRSIISFIQDKKPGNMLLGLTATPGRTWSDIEADEKLSEFFGNRKVTLRIEGYTNPIQYLVDEGYLAKPTFRTLNFQAGLSLSSKDLAEISRSHDIPEKILNAIGENGLRNIKIITCAEQLSRRHSRLIVFATSVAHAHLISSILNIRGLRSFAVTGSTEKSVREHILHVFKSAYAEPIVICNYGVLTTGFDAPRTSAAIIARPTMSLVLYSQMVGRAIRGIKAGGNTEAEIITVVDPELPGFGNLAEAFRNWEDVWKND